MDFIMNTYYFILTVLPCMHINIHAFHSKVDDLPSEIVCLNVDWQCIFVYPYSIF